MTFYRFARRVAYIIAKFKYNIIIINKKDLPQDRGFVICSNHRSNWDPIFLGIGFNRTVHFMAKKELFENKIMSFLMYKVGSFPVSRGEGDGSAIEKAVEIVQSGRVLGIFPEGTRSKDGNLRRAKSGAVLIAQKTGGDIIPVGIYYGKRKIIRREVVITYGEPIYNNELIISDASKSEMKVANKLLMDRIKSLIGDER